MGQKVHPTGIRLGISKDWSARWYAERADFAENLNSDLAARRFIEKELAQAAVSHIQIDRPAKQAQVTIHTARPGIVIGKKGEDIERLRRRLTDLLGVPTAVSVSEIRKPELDATLVAESIAQQLERRIMFRRAMKRAVGNAIRLGAQGIKVQVSGRLNGADIARTEWYREGRVPLHTLRAGVDYGTAVARTTYGVIGVKVWVYTGDVFDLGAARSEEQKPSRKGGGREK
ncbi:MAG: 30S ribosomal protein S3 [Wenzhouxiangellaceae bacterium]|nr:30S ribosomal protein S3 [Wenzhouxiangellaceae bacterium]